MVIWLVTEYANGKFRERFARYQILQDQGAGQVYHKFEIDKV